MTRTMKFFIILFAIQYFHFVECFPPRILKWSQNLGDFVPVNNISMFEGNKLQETRISAIHNDRLVNMEKSRQKENHNFQRQELVLAYFEDNDTVNFHANYTKVTGACGEMWNILADYSNFTLKTKKIDEMGSHLKRKNFAGSLLDLIKDDWINIIPKVSFSIQNQRYMDLTTPIWETRHKLYIQLEREVDTNWMFNMFTYKVWSAIIILLLILSISGYLMEKILSSEYPDHEFRHGFDDHLFYTFSTLCSQACEPETLDRRRKLFGLTKKIFAWLLLLVFSAHLISYMTNRKLQRQPFEDIESLLNNTNYSVKMYNRSIAYDKLELLKFSLEIREYNVTNRIKKAWTREQLYAEACSPDEKIAIFALEDVKLPVGARYCDLVPIGKPYFPTWVTFGVSKNLIYKRTFDIGILKMREFGLIDGLKKRWLKPQTVNSEAAKHATFTPVNLDQVVMLLIIFSVGIITSVSTLVVENIVYIYKRYQRRIVRGKLLKENRITTNCWVTDNDVKDTIVTKRWTFGCWNNTSYHRDASRFRISKIFTCQRQ